MELTTPHLILRSITREDAQAMWDGADLESVAPDVHPVAGYPVARSGMAFGQVARGMGRMDEEGRGMFWIIRAEDHAVVGDVTMLTPEDHPTALLASMEIAPVQRGGAFSPNSDTELLYPASRSGALGLVAPCAPLRPSGVDPT